MWYCGLMGFGAQIPVHRVGGMEMLWHLRGYGLSEVWFTRGSTVTTLHIGHSHLVILLIAAHPRTQVSSNVPSVPPQYNIF
jgi:hypothetical protein